MHSCTWLCNIKEKGFEPLKSIHEVLEKSIINNILPSLLSLISCKVIIKFNTRKSIDKSEGRQIGQLNKRTFRNICDSAFNIKQIVTGFLMHGSNWIG